MARVLLLFVVLEAILSNGRKCESVCLASFSGTVPICSDPFGCEMRLKQLSIATIELIGCLLNFRSVKCVTLSFLAAVNNAAGWSQERNLSKYISSHFPSSSLTTDRRRIMANTCKMM
uniref:Secreted protein n=1 Tax=Ascaris lumbricoides TaxID=6252 RepID=A0A9J2PEG1_ASCLU